MVQLAIEQELALEEIEKTDGPVLITGSAGTGKSVVLKELVARIGANAKIAVSAPTGVAALNVGGMTLHSLFGFKVGLIIAKDWHFRQSGSEYFRALEWLVIDEVSMVRVDLMDGIDMALRFHRRNNLPFGGVKIVMFGDPYQLPPVVSPMDIYESTWSTYAWRKYRGKHYFFDARVFSRAPIRILELQEIHRQSDDLEFANILNRIRVGRYSDRDLEVLRENSKQELPNHEALRVFGKNDVVDSHNRRMLAQIPPENATKYPYIWEANRESKGVPLDSARRFESFPGELSLDLKIGARVIFIKNDDQSGSGSRLWVNGTLGTVTGLSPHKIGVRLDSGSSVTVGRSRFELRELVRASNATVGGSEIRAEVTGWITQFPLRLGWAITVHKSQGQTLDEVVLDFEDQYFAGGQAYVALSRVKSLDTMYFISSPSSSEILAVDFDVNVFMRKAEHSPFNSVQIALDTALINESRLKEIAKNGDLDTTVFEDAIRHQVSISTVFTSYEHFIRETAALLDTGQGDRALSRLNVVFRRYFEENGGS